MTVRELRRLIENPGPFFAVHGLYVKEDGSAPDPNVPFPERTAPMKYKVKITELIQPTMGAGIVGSTGSFAPPVEGATIFETTIDHRPDLVKLSEAVKPPRIRKPRSAKA